MNPDEAPKRTQSGEMPALKGDLKETQAHVEKTMGQRLTINYVATILVVIAGCWGVFKVVLHEAQAQTDAGVVLVKAVTEEKLKAVEQRMDWLDKQIAETKSVGQATNDTVNKLAIRFNVVPSQPKPVPPRDGGQ